MKLSAPPFDLDARRREARRARRSIDDAVRAAADERIAAATASALAGRGVGPVASYVADDGEVDLGAFHDRWWASGHSVWLPVVTDAGSLEFRRHEPHDELVPNRYGVLEPRTGPRADAFDLDAIVMPMVGFDELGNRVGRGGGYYDRTLADRRRPRPLLVGVAYASQRFEGLVPDPHDVPVDLVITEAGVLAN